MMDHAPSKNRIVRAAGACLLAALLPGTSAVAQEEGWLPVVVQLGKPEAAPQPVRPYTPQMGRPAVAGRRYSAPSVRIPPIAPRTVTTQLPFRASSPIETGALPESAASTLVLAAAGDPAPSGEAAPGVQLPSSDLAQRYCVSIADQAAEARLAWQKAKLAEAEQQIDERIATLEAKTAEFRTWLERREKFVRKVTQKLAKIYEKMEPDAAAAQLVSMDEEAAASILAKLDPRNSSAVMNEMQPQKAARLAATLVGAARTANKKPVPSNPPAEGPPGAPPDQARAPGQPNGDGGEL